MVERLVILNRTVLDNWAIVYSHDIGRQIIDLLTGSVHAFTPSSEIARDAKMADDAIPNQHLLDNLRAAIWESSKERGSGIGQT